MRDIKFRFQKLSGKLLLLTLQELMHSRIDEGEISYAGQWTGMKDKNGVEIYEGDILKLNIHEWYFPECMAGGGHMKNEVAKVEFDLGVFGVKVVAPWDNFHPIFALGTHASTGTTEVVGNIYEHSHLLNGDTELMEK